VRDEDWSVAIPPALEAHGLLWSKTPHIQYRVPGRRLWVILRNLIAFLRANWRFVRIAQQFRPTHIHAFNQVYVVNYLIGLFLVRTPMIYRAGDEPTRHNMLWRAAWRFVVWRTERFVANSEFVANSLRSSGVRGERITVIYNKPPSRPALQQRRLQLELPDVSRGICYIGQIAEHKGPHVLVEGFREVAVAYPEARLFIAGRISDWEGDAWGRALRGRVEKDALLGASITFLGELEDVPGLLDRCEFLVVPSLFADPSPNVVMEAKQAGRAAIVFPRGGLRELIEHGVDGYICRECTVPALAAALRIYLDDPARGIVQGRAAKASCGRLGVPEFGQKWCAVYGIAKGASAATLQRGFSWRRWR
jgi:glycosyltransferase involved in cell wall biosynthesis